MTTTDARPRDTADTDLDPARPQTDWSYLDLGLAIALAIAAGSLRLGSFPRDGLYHDDAWVAAPITLASPSQWLRTSVEHPGFTALFAPLGVLVRHRPSLLVVPVFVAGALAPAVIFWFLRALSYRRSIACALATLVVVAPTAVSLSGHLKSYVVDCSIVAALAVLLVPLANTRWRTGLACAWVIAAVLLGTFSIYALVATAVAGVILVLHPRGDVRVRLIAVAVQGVVQLGYLAFISGTYSGDALHAFWKASDGYVELRANPFTTAGNFVDHLRGVFSVYPTDAHGLALIAGVAALVGLAYAAWRTRAVSARFLLLLFAVAAAGGILQVLPFGAWQGFSYWGRLTLWLVPSIALGLAEVLRQCGRWIGRHSIARTTFDIVLYVCAVAVFVASIGQAPPYTVRGSHTATAYIDAHRGPDDLLVLVPRSAYAYGIETRAPVDFRPDAQSIVGSRLVFDDHTVQFEYRPAPDIRDRSARVRTVYVYAAVPRRGILQRAQPVIDQLRAAGFHERHRLRFHDSRLQIWTRGP